MSSCFPPTKISKQQLMQYVCYLTKKASGTSVTQLLEHDASIKSLSSKWLSSCPTNIDRVILPMTLFATLVILQSFFLSITCYQNTWYLKTWRITCWMHLFLSKIIVFFLLLRAAAMLGKTHWGKWMLSVVSVECTFHSIWRVRELILFSPLLLRYISLC